MKPNETEHAQILLALCRSALTQTIDPRLKELITTNSNWEEVFSMASCQGVMAIAWDGVVMLQQSGMFDPAMLPQRALRLKWALSVEGVEKRYARQLTAIAKLATIYNEAGIEMTILKGYGLSLCYPTPQHRACSDIDIYLGGEQKRADELLRTTYDIKIDEGLHHHTVFYIDGVMVENHYDFINIHAHSSSRTVEQELKRCAEQRGEVVEVEGRVVRLPNANLHALFMLRHAAAHFAGAEIVLRHIYDWAMYLRAHHADIDWTWLNAFCKEQKMERFLYAMNGLAVELCDVEPSLPKGSERIRDIEQRILNDTLRPEFSKPRPKQGLMRIVWFKLQRWWANRWKRKLVYREADLHSFITQAWSHLLKPKGIKH